MMKNRCLNHRATDFAYYGALGVSIPSSWYKYEGFLADMGERPDGLTIDRINPAEPYSKKNCRWTTRLVQSQNRKFIRRYTHKRVTRTTWEWAESLGLSLHGFHSRLYLYRQGRITDSQLFEPRKR